MSILELIVIGSATVFFGFYVVYFLICLRYYRLNVTGEVFSFSETQLPKVSIIVPVYNESKMVESRIENFSEFAYPMNKFEVVFVDGGSNDGTLEKIESHAEGLSFELKIVKQGSRKGFNSAVIEGFNQTTGDIIFITGAETKYERNAVRLIIDHFADPRVGAVNGTMRLSNSKEGNSTKIEAAYRTLYDFIREAESKIDIPFDIKGEIVAARRAIYQRLVDRTDMLRKGSIDFACHYQAKKDGFHTVYEPLAVYYEPVATSLHDSFKQMIRRAAVMIENMLAFKELILRRKYGKFGTLILPAHLLMLIVLPWFFLLFVGGTLLLLLFNPLNYYLIGFVIFAFLAIVGSRKIQAVVKVQISLVLATAKMLKGIETQKFERLSSARS